MMSERLGRWSFWLVFGGFHLTFFPQHLLGLMGMPRRVYTYLPGRGWTGLNQLATAGAILLGCGVLLFVANAARSLRAGEAAGSDPWGADTLEWSLPSPPPVYGHLHLPIVAGREGLWAPGAGTAFVTGLDPDTTEVLVSSLLDAEPELRSYVAGPSIWPFLTALSVCGTITGALFTPWALPIGLLPIFLTLLGWVVKTEGGGGDRTEKSSAAARDPAPAAAA
jgi:cytochrome c oxidase subunit 1